MSADFTVAAAMSIPRVGYNATWGCILDSLAPFKIPVFRGQGAFWDQCLELAIESALKTGPDFILTIDYDSVFNTGQLNRLMDHFASNPEIDALCAYQTKRGIDQALGMFDGKPEMSKMFAPMKSAHFGLTLLRAEKLDELPKPWFLAHPDSRGKWIGDDKIDSDQHFWRQWDEAGYTVATDLTVRIGHIEEIVKYIGEDDQVRYMKTQEFIEECVKQERSRFNFRSAD